MIHNATVEVPANTALKVGHQWYALKNLGRTLVLDVVHEQRAYKLPPQLWSFVSDWTHVETGRDRELSVTVGVCESLELNWPNIGLIIKVTT